LQHSHPKLCGKFVDNEHTLEQQLCHQRQGQHEEMLNDHQDQVQVPDDGEEEQEEHRPDAIDRIINSELRDEAVSKELAKILQDKHLVSRQRRRKNKNGRHGRTQRETTENGYKTDSTELSSQTKVSSSTHEAPAPLSDKSFRIQEAEQVSVERSARKLCEDKLPAQPREEAVAGELSNAADVHKQEHGSTLKTGGLRNGNFPSTAPILTVRKGFPPTPLSGFPAGEGAGHLQPVAWSITQYHPNLQHTQYAPPDFQTAQLHQWSLQNPVGFQSQVVPCPGNFPHIQKAAARGVGVDVFCWSQPVIPLPFVPMCVPSSACQMAAPSPLFPPSGTPYFSPVTPGITLTLQQGNVFQFPPPVGYAGSGGTRYFEFPSHGSLVCSNGGDSHAWFSQQQIPPNSTVQNLPPVAAPSAPPSSYQQHFHKPFPGPGCNTA
jgi:hypothetical protein